MQKFTYYVIQLDILLFLFLKKTLQHGNIRIIQTLFCVVIRILEIIVLRSLLRCFLIYSDIFYILWKKRTILHSKWTLLKSCCFFPFSLSSIINLALDFKSPLLDIETIVFWSEDQKQMIQTFRYWSYWRCII